MSFDLIERNSFQAAIGRIELRYRNSRQARAIEECIFADIRNALRNRKAVEPGARSESIIANRGYAIRDDHVGQAGAQLKGPISD